MSVGVRAQNCNPVCLDLQTSVVLMGSLLTQFVKRLLFTVKCKFKIRDDKIFNIILYVTRGNSSKLRVAASRGTGEAEHAGPQVVNNPYSRSNLYLILHSNS